MAAVGSAIGLIFISFRLPGGDDLYRYYLPFAQGCLDCGYVPYYAQWFLLPLRLFPGHPFAWGVWTIISTAVFLSLAYVTRVNPLLLFLSFPMLGQVWLGQVDMLVALGLVVFLFGRNPYLRGVGLIFALTKPQLTALPLISCLLLESPRLWFKLLLAPATIFAASLMTFGLGWPVEWFKNAVTALPIHVWRLASLDIWKFGIFITPIVLLFRDPRERLTAGLLVSSLATPFYGVYSYVLFLLFDAKWWGVLLSYVWLLGFSFWQESAMRFAWVLPAGMLLAMIVQNVKTRRMGDRKIE